MEEIISDTTRSTENEARQLDTEFGFDSETWRNIELLDEKLPDIAVFEPEVTNALRKRHQEVMENLKSAVQQIKLVERQKRELSQLNISASQSESLKLITEKTNEIATQILATQEPRVSTTNIHTKITVAISRLFRRNVDKVATQKVATTQTQVSGHNPHSEVQTVQPSEFKVELLSDSSLSEEYQLTKQMIREISGRIPDLVNQTIRKCSPSILSEEINEDVTQKWTHFLEKLQSRMTGLQQEMNRRKDVLYNATFEAAVAFKSVVASISALYEPFIYPKNSADQLPEVVWWSKQTVALTIYCFKQLTDIVNDFPSAFTGDVLSAARETLTTIKKKIDDASYFIENAPERLDLAHSPDVLYHSTPHLSHLISILTDGKLRSLGSLRSEFGGDFSRTSDNLGDAKKANQELHQIYFNTLGPDVTYPKGYARNVYSPMLIQTDLVKNNTEIVALLDQEMRKTRVVRERIAALKRKYGITSSYDESRFQSSGFSTRESAFSEAGIGVDELPRDFYIASGFFFLKRNLLNDRQFAQTDGVAVFDSKYGDQEDQNFLELNWKNEGCLATDRLGWLVIKELLTQELIKEGRSADISTMLSEIESHLVLFEEDEWGGNFSQSNAVYLKENPNELMMPDGQIISQTELDFLLTYSHLDEADLQRKEYYQAQIAMAQFNNGAVDRARHASDRVTSFVRSKMEQPAAYRIMPTLRKGDLPNADGASKVSTLYTTKKV